MRKIGLVFCIQLLMVMLFFSNSAKAADWRFPVGLTYISGFGDVVDIYKGNLEAEGYSVSETSYIPVGLSFQPYVQLDNGLGIGAGIGPFSMIISNVASFFDVPVNLDLRYVFLHDGKTSPYVRAGVKQHFASGDYVNGSTPGFFGGIGIEFARKKRVGFGMEVAYDSSEIELEKKTKDKSTNKVISTTESVQPHGLMASIFITF